MNLSDRMKMYERVNQDRLMPLLPVLARLDGRSFHSFTKGLERPYDKDFQQLMVQTTMYLVQETHAKVGYTQSDEITLLWYSNDVDSQIFFDRRIAKMNSVLASMASVRFVTLLPRFLPEKVGHLPVFDCRVWTVPSKEEAVNVFVWREQDATRNSIIMAAQSVYSHKALMGKNSPQMQDMLHVKSINWNDYPSSFKRGTYVRRKVVTRKITPTELESLPPRHDAHQNPTLEYTRTITEIMDMPILTKVTNRVEVLFDGHEPVVVDLT